MLVLQFREAEEQKDRLIAIIFSALSILIILVIAWFTSFFIHPPISQDTPPIESDEVVEEFVIDNVKVLTEEGGGSGSGTPTSDPIDEPAPQTEKMLTQSNSDTKVNSGASNNQTAPNSENRSSSTQRSTHNPFGSGGDGGGSGSGSGKGFGNDAGNGGQGNGLGSGNGTAKPRIRLNDPKVDHIKTDVSVVINLKLTISENGEVVSASNIASKTTTTDQRIINQVISEVKKQVKYNKDPGAGMVQVYLTVRINAT